MEQTATLHDGFDISGKLSKARSTLVRVTGGVHQGGELEFEGGTISIGTEADNDMVLFAEDICAHHCRLERKRSPLSPVTIFAVEGAVVINGRRTINPGEYATLKGSFTLDMGDCQITVSPAIEYSSYAVPALKIALLLALLFIAWIGWNLATSLFSNVVTIGSNMGGLVTNGANTLAGSIAPEKTNNEKLVWTVRSKLEELNLNAAVRATTMGDGNIHLSGVIAKSQSGRWSEFLQWYDQNPNYPTLVRDIRKNASEPAAPKIESVWLNGTPTVHFKSGKSAKVGDKIGDGWEIRNIDRNGVTITRDGSPVILKF